MENFPKNLVPNDFASIEKHVYYRCGPKPEPEITYTAEELEELLKAFDEVDEEVLAEPVTITVELIKPHLESEPELIPIELIKTGLTEDDEIFFEETLEPVELLQSKQEPVSIAVKPEITKELSLKQFIILRKKKVKKKYSEEDRSLFSKVNTTLNKEDQEALLEPVELIQSKQEQELEPELTKEFALEQLKTIYKKIDKMEYSEEDRNQFSKINTTLIKSGISPYARDYKIFNQIACKNNFISLYMVDLQVHDLHWIHSQYHGHEVDGEAMDGCCKGIFTDPTFDPEKAMKIAIGSFEDTKGNIKNLTIELKRKHLRLPDHIMKELSIIQSREIRTYYENIFKQKKKDKDAKGEFEIEKSNIKHRLENFLKGYLPKNKFIQNADECLSIWIAIKNTGGDITKYKNISSEYEKITGIEIKPATVRDRVTFLKKALIL